MARSPAERASHAAGDILDWLGSRPFARAKPDPDVAAVLETERDRFSLSRAGEGSLAPIEPAEEHRPVRLVADKTRPAVTPAHTDWLFHRLQVSGSEAHRTAFQAAAAGAGVIPWHLDLDRMEEDFFLRVAAPPPGHARTLSMEGCRILAAELREAVARRHAWAVARVGQSAACPFDLHALLPVPERILQLGPDHPAALTWLWEHWGTTHALRHVAVEVDRARRRPGPTDAAVLAVSFWSADWTPWRAVTILRERWPALGVTVTPHYELA